MNRQVLMCTPNYFGVFYKINPWMHPEKDVVNKGKAINEWNNLVKSYKDLGVDVQIIEQDKDLPDMVYAANYGFVEGSIFIQANFKFDQRKKEAEIAGSYFKNAGFQIKKLPDDIIFEGQGDFLKVGDKYFMGWGKRSDKGAKDYLAKILKSKVIDLKLIDPYYYHLDTCFAPLDENTVCINPLSFDKENLEKISKNFKNVINVSLEDNKILACNLVVIGKNVVTSSYVSQNFKKDLKKYDFSTIEVEMGEFRKGGGSVKCLTLEFN